MLTEEETKKLEDEIREFEEDKNFSVKIFEDEFDPREWKYSVTAFNSGYRLDPTCDVSCTLGFSITPDDTILAGVISYIYTKKEGCIDKYFLGHKLILTDRTGLKDFQNLVFNFKSMIKDFEKIKTEKEALSFVEKYHFEPH